MRITTRSARETLRLGKQLTRYLLPGDIVCLFGELGSGKTVLTKGIASGLGIARAAVVSPSFVLVRPYAARIPLYHFDLYRLKSPEDILGLGFEEYLYADGITVIEWADRLKYLLPRECLKVRLTVSRDTSRRIDITPAGKRHAKLTRSLQKDHHNS